MAARGVFAASPCQPSPPPVPIGTQLVLFWLANGAKIGTVLSLWFLGTFLVWCEHGSATTIPNLIKRTSSRVWGAVGIMLTVNVNDTELHDQLPNITKTRNINFNY